MPLASPTSTTRICLLFVVTTVFLSAPFWFLYFHASRPGTGTYLEYLMWCPAFAAFITLRQSHLSLNSIGWERPNSRYVGIAVLVPAVYFLISYAVLWSVGWGGFDWDFTRRTGDAYVWSRLPLLCTVLLYFVTAGPVGILNATVSAAGEEIGWRGLLAPRLTSSLGFFPASLIGGLIWAAWHYPLFFRGSVKLPDLIFPMACFTASIGGAAFFATWLRVRSGSVWPPVLFHASHNTFLGMMTKLTVSNNKTDRYADETGLLLAAFGVGMAVLFTFLERTQRSRPFGENQS